MRTDWLPVSAALFLTGALALALGSYLLPSADGTDEAVRLVQEQGGLWMAAAVIDFVASVFLTLGLPSVLALFERRGRVLGLVSLGVLAFGFIGTAGYAMLLAFFRALVVTDTIRTGGVDDVAHDAGLLVLVYAWLAAFVLGELLLGLALLRSGTIARWVPLVLLLHVALSLVAVALPDGASKLFVLLFVVAAAGIAIEVNSPATRRRVG